MGFLKDAKIVSSTDTLKPVQGAKVVFSDQNVPQQPTPEPVEDKTWFTDFKDKLFNREKEAIDYIYGKDIEKRDIKSPEFPIVDQKGDNLESSLYRFAALKTTGKLNPSPEEMDNPYVMEKLIQNKNAIDLALKSAKELSKKTQDPTILTDFYERNIKPAYQRDDFSLKTELQKDIYAKKGAQLRAAGTGFVDELAFETLESPYGFFEKTFDPGVGSERTRINGQDLKRIENEIGILQKQYDDFYKQRFVEPSGIKKQEGDKILQRIEDLKTEYNARKQDILKSEKQEIKNAEKDLGDLFQLDANIFSDLQATYRYGSAIPEATRDVESIKNLVDQKESDFLYNISKYGTVVSNMQSTEILDANMLTFEKTSGNNTLKNLLEKKVQYSDLEKITADLLVDKIKFQEDTYNGIVALEQNIKANKNPEYGIPSLIKQLEQSKKDRIEEYRKKGIFLTEEQLSPYNNEILKYNKLLEYQDVLQGKLNETKKKYLSGFKDEKALREESSKLAEAYLKEKNKPVLDMLKFEIGSPMAGHSGPAANMLYNMTIGIADVIGSKTISLAGATGIISEKEALKQQMSLYENANRINYIPEPMKNREALKVTEKDGKYQFDYDVAGIFTEGITTFVQSLGLAKAGQVIGKNLLKLPVLGKAAPFVSEGFMTGIGGIVASNVMLSEIDRQNYEAFLRGEIEWDDVGFKSTLEKSLEGATEMLWTPELKMLNPVGQDIVKKYAHRQFAKQALTRSMVTQDLEYLAKSLVKNLVQTPVGEVIEELAGNKGQDIIIDPIFKERNLRYNPEKNFTLLNNIQTAGITYLSMLPTAIMGLGGDIANRRNISKMVDYEIGKNANEYLNYAIAGIISLTDEQFSKTYPQFSSKQEAIAATDRVYDLYNKTYQKALPVLDFIPSETDKKDYFDTSLEIQRISSKPEKTEKDLERLESLTLKKMQYDLEVQELKSKPIREQVASTLEENIKNLATEEVNVPTLQAVVTKLQSWKNTLIGDDKYKDKVDIIDQKIKEVNKRIEDLKPTDPNQRLIEQEKRNRVAITENTGTEREIEIGKKVLIGRKVEFGAVDPIRYPEVTFLGYDKDESGAISTINGSPVVVFESAGKKYKLPVSYFSNYKIGSEEGIDTDAAKFYYAWGNKRFTLSLDKTKKANYFAKYRQFKDINQDSIDGVLSFEDGKLYFNFVHPETKQPRKIELNDFYIKQYDKYKNNAFFRPKTKLDAGIVTEDFESITARELYESELFNEKEQKQYEEFVKNTKFQREKALREQQAQRRTSILRDYILNEVLKEVKQIEKALSKVDETIEKIQSLVPLLREAAKISALSKKAGIKDLLTEKEYEEFSKLTPYKQSRYLLEKAKLIEKGSYEELQNLSTELARLESLRASKETEIQEELAFAEELANREYDPEQKLGDQITEERKQLQKLLKENEDFVETLKSKINWFKNLISSFGKAVDNIYDFLSQEPDPNTTPLEIQSYINDLESQIKEKDEESEKLRLQIAKFERVENYLRPLQEAEDKRQALIKKKEVSELLERQSKSQSSNEPPTDSNFESKKTRDGQSAAKDLSIINHSTISGGEDYQKQLQNPTNNFAFARFVYFTNKVNPIGLKLLAVTAKSVNAIKEKYGVDLSNILYEDKYNKKENDVKFVVIKETATGIAFIDMEGNEIQDPSTDNVIYTSLSKSETLLKSGQGELRYNKKELPENEKEAKEYLDAIQAEFTEFRNLVLASETPLFYNIEGISRGIPKYDNQKETDEATSEEKFENTINRKPIQGTLVSEDADLVGLIIIGKVGTEKGGKQLTKVIDHNGRDINVPVGRPLLVSKENAKTQLLDNHLISETKQADLFNLIRLLSKKILQATEEDFEQGNQIIDTNITNYLRTILYWRNPDVSKQEVPSSNQMWISFNPQFGPVLNIGITEFVLSELEENLTTLEGILSKVWHNVDAASLAKENKKYVEISNVNVEKGTYDQIIWDSYEDYLLSNKNPDGTARDIKDIPLTTNIITNVNPIEEGTIKPNYTPQYEGKYFIFEREFIGKNGTQSTKAQEDTPPSSPMPATPAAPVTPAAAPTAAPTTGPVTSSVSPDVLDSVIEQYKRPMNFPDNVDVDEHLGKIVANINILKSLKPNTIYSYFSNAKISTVFDFKGVFQNGKLVGIEIVDVKNQDTFDKIKNALSVDSVTLEEFLKLEKYASTGSISLLHKFKIIEGEQIPSVETQDNKKEEKAPETIDAAAAFGIKPEEPVEEKDFGDLFGGGVDQGEPGANRLPTATFGNYQIINIEKAKEFLNRVLPQIEFRDVEGLIDGVAWGRFVKNAIILSRYAEIGTEYHEAFEAVAGLILSKRQWKALVNEFKRRQGTFIEYNTGKELKYSEATEEQIKEQIAEEYREYGLSGGKTIYQGQIRRNNLFRRIYNLITNLVFGKPDTIAEVFEKIHTAKYANAPVSEWNRPWNLNKSYRIANIENGIFNIELNKSMSYLLLSNLISRYGSVYSLIEAEIIPDEIYGEIKQDLSNYYSGVKNAEGVFVQHPMFQKLSVDKIEESLKNEAFAKQIIQNINTLPEAFRLMYNQVLNEAKTKEEIVPLFQSKMKDAITSYKYILSDWDTVVNESKNYIKKFNIAITETKKEKEGDSVEIQDEGFVKKEEETKGKTEYTPDSFSVDYKENANSEVKFVLATLSKRRIVTKDGKVLMDDEGLPVTQAVLNRLGLPEVQNFSDSFRTVFNTVKDATDIFEMLEAIKAAAIQNPEFVYLYKRLGGGQINPTKEQQRLRIAFNSSMNRFKSSFSRGLLEQTDEGLTINIVDSEQDQVQRVLKEKWVTNLKNLYQEKPEYFKELETGDIRIVIKGTDLARLAESKNLSDKFEFAKKLGIEFDFDYTTISQRKRDELYEALTMLQNIMLNSNAAIILAGEKADFNSTLDKLATIEFSVTNRNFESSHYNIDKERQQNIVGLSFFTKIIKDVRSVSSIEEMIMKNPHLADIYHQGSYLLKKHLFKNGKRTKFPIDIVPAEGLINVDTQDGKGTSKLPFNKKIAYEFANNLRGIFYVLNPADVKTEYGLTYWGNVKSSEKRFVQSELARNYNYIFNEFFKNYLKYEIEMARDIKQNPNKRDVAEYNREVITKNSGIRKKGESLRAFDGILSFDYTDVIDRDDIDVDQWINSNKDTIVKNIQDFIESINDQTLKQFIENEVITKVDKNSYALVGFEIDALRDYGIKQAKVENQKVLDLINERSVNYLINIFEQFSFFLGDPSQSNDPFKRIKPFVVSAETTTYDTEMSKGNVFDNFANKNYNTAFIENEIGELEEVQLPEDAPGYRNFDSTFKGTTIEDVEIVEKSTNRIANAHREREATDVFFKPFNELTDFLKNHIEKSVIDPIKKVYENVVEPDGQAYMILPLYREFLRRSSMWNPDLESLYQYDLAYERTKVYKYPDTEQGRNLKEIDKKIVEKGNPNAKRIAEGKDPITYPVIKPIGAGVKAGELSIRDLDKMSVFPLSYRLLEKQGAKGLKVYNYAQKEGSQYIRFKSAQKEGAPNNLTKLYNEKGEIQTNFTATDRLMFKHFSIQVETRGMKNKIARGTQLTKLAIINLMNAGIPVDFVKSTISKMSNIPDSSTVTNNKELKKYLKEVNAFNKQLLREASVQWFALSEEERLKISPVYKAVTNHNNALTAMTEVYKKELYNEIGAKETETGIEISNYEALEKIIKEELEERGSPKDLINGVALKDGKFEIPFDFLSNGFKVQPLLLSLIDTRIAKPKVNGKSLAQVASTMFEKHKRDLVYLKDDIWTKVDDYNSLSEEDKKTVRITSNDLAFYEEDGKQYMEIYLPAIFKDKLGNFISDTGEIDPELLKAVGYRIPTQELSAVENIRIKGFLPVEYGNTVIVPSAITGKAGSDFDIDKLNIYLFNYYISLKTGKPTKIKFDDRTTDEAVKERYENFKRRNPEVKEIYKKYSERIKKINESIQKSWQIQTGQLNKLIEEKQLDEKQIEDLYVAKKEKQSQLKNQLATVKENRLILKELEEGFQEDEAATNLLASKLMATKSLDPFSILNQAALELEESENEVLLLEEQIEKLENKLKSISSEKLKKADIEQKVERRTKRQEEYVSQRDELFRQRTDEINSLVPDITFEEFLKLSVEQQNSKKALENRYFDTLITLLELPENYTRLTTPNSAKVLQDGAAKIQELNEIAELRKDGKTEEEIEEIVKEKKSQGKSKIKPLDIFNWVNPVKNSVVRYSFQVGKEGVGIGAVGITNHAINQLVNSLGVGFDSVTIYFPTNPTEVLDINGNRKTVTSMSFTRDSSGEWISNNISAFISGFVDIAKDPFIIKINGTADTAGSYIISNKLGMSLEDTILLFNQPIVREFERLMSLKNDFSLMTKKDVLSRVIEQYGSPGFIDYIDGSFVPNKQMMLSKRVDPFETEELEEFIKSKYSIQENRINQSILLGIYLEIKNGSESLLEAVGTYNYDTAKLIDFISVISKEQENLQYEKTENPLVPKVIINTENLFFNNIKKTYNEFTSSVKDIFISMENEVFNNVTYPEVKGFFEMMMSSKDRLKAVAAVQREVVNYLILTTPVTLFEKEIIIGDYVEGLLGKSSKQANILSGLKNQIKEGTLIDFYGIKELFPTIAGKGKRKTNNIRLLNKQKDVEYSDIITESWKEAEASSNQELSRFIKNLYIIALLQSGVNQSRISISQYLPSDFMKEIGIQIVEKLRNNEIDFSMFRPYLYANKWNDSNFTRKLSKKETSYYSDFQDRYVSRFYKGTDFGIPVDVYTPTFIYKKNDQTVILKKFLPNYQLSKVSMAKDPATGEPYPFSKIKELRNKGIDPFETKIYQRVELDKEPIVYFDKEANSFYFLYREVTKKGDGQYALEYAEKSAIYENIPYQSDEEILQSLKNKLIPYFKVSEVLASQSDPNEPDPRTTVSEETSTLSQATPALPTTPTVTTEAFDNTPTSIEGLNERLDSYGNARLVLSSDFYEGERPKGRLNAFKSSISSVADNLIVLRDLNLNEFDFISEQDKKRLDALRPLAEELRMLNMNDISSNRRTVDVEKRYAQLTNQLTNEFVDIIGKYVKEQIGKTITSSKPRITQPTTNVNAPEGLPSINRTNKNC